MNENYDDLLNLERPVYPDLPPMSIENRAAQFSPFAAVVGYKEAVDESARFTDSRVTLQEDAVYELNIKLEQLRDDLKNHPRVRVTYFEPDKLKAGGKYVEYEGTVKKIDEYNGIMVFSDGMRISIPEIADVMMIGRPD